MLNETCSENERLKLKLSANEKEVNSDLANAADLVEKQNALIMSMEAKVLQTLMYNSFHIFNS